jgi:hypothetical protein
MMAAATWRVQNKQRLQLKSAYIRHRYILLMLLGM